VGKGEGLSNFRQIRRGKNLKLNRGGRGLRSMGAQASRGELISGGGGHQWESLTMGAASLMSRGRRNERGAFGSVQPRERLMCGDSNL